MPIEREQNYATTEARDAAEGRGFVLSLADWRGIFLAITDTMATDGARNILSQIVASYIGPVRFGERWTIMIGARGFDAMYDPGRALIYRVTDTPSAPAKKMAPTGPASGGRILEAA